MSARDFSVLVAALLVVGATAVSADSDRKHYDGYTVYRLTPENINQVKYLSTLAEDEASGLDFWVPPSRVGRRVDINVSPLAKNEFLKNLEALDIKKEVMIDDLESEIQHANATTYELPDLRIPKTFYTDYQRLDTIHKYLKGFGVTRKSIASTLSIGKSTEDRDLLAIKISNGRPGKRAIWFDGGIHAREWISPATVLYITEQLIEGYEKDDDVTKIIDTFDFYILPVANPDGYEYSHTRDRMWRKTRSNTGSIFACRGADPNRNFGFKWNTGGASNNPCSETYAGARAFSEPETKAMSDFIYARRREILAYVTFHSYSQLWLTPWGYTSALPENYNELERIAKIATSALSKLYGTRYTVGSSTNVLYVASGGSDDWAMGGAGIPYSYTVELRDTGRHGFVLPKEHIIPSGQETWAGIKAMLLELVKAA